MGILDNTFGAALDPQTIGLLQAAAAGLQASGPSLTPTSFGQVAGKALGAGTTGYMGALTANRQNAQAEALINLERQKAVQAGLSTQLQFEDANMRRSILGLPPVSMPSGGGLGPQAPQGLPGMPSGQPSSMPTASLGAAPGPSGNTPQPMGGLPPSSPLAQLPPDAQQAIRLNAALPGSGSIAMQATAPVIGREGGIYKRNPDGSMVLDPGWIKGEEQRLRLQKGIEDEHTVVEIKLANGQEQKMTKAQQLSLVGATSQIKAAVPGLSDTAITDIQRQMVADPEKSIDLNITLGGRQAKLTIPALKDGMPGITSGQSTEARSAQEASGTQAGGVQAEINKEADNALTSRRILGEMRVLSQDFTPSKIAPMQRALGEYAQALGLPGDWSKEIKSAESQQALQKLTAQMATAAMKQFTNRGTQMEFKTFLQNNPNAELTPGGFQKVLEFMDKSAQMQLDKQQAYKEWRVSNPVEKSQDFLAEWNKKMAAEVIPGGKPALPTKGQVVDGWEFVGGDPANRMNWRKK